MLETLSIKDYATVEYLEVNLTSGMTCITGETGAGKSIMLDALALCIGDRADTSAIRTDAERTEIIASFDISSNSRAKTWLSERDLQSADECILRRIISASGRSRAYINGTQSTLADCADLGRHLVDIYSQHAHQSLLRAATQRQLLDTFGETGKLLNELSLVTQKWRMLHDEFNQLILKTDEANGKKDFLVYQIAELETVNPQSNELLELEANHKLFSNSSFIIESLNRIADGCDQNRDQLSHLLHLCQDQRLTCKAGDSIRELLTSILIQLDEAQSEARHFNDTLSVNPDSFAEIESRLSRLYELARKHRVTAEELPELLDRFKKDLELLCEGSARMEVLDALLKETTLTWQNLASSLSDERQMAALKLSEDVMSTLSELAMDQCIFQVSVEPRKKQLPDAKGADDIEFRVATNPGANLAPLSKVASGGELSRISLALQVVAAGTGTAPTVVFDEVDVGVGGGVAEVVGKLLRKISRDSQILVVTHQPQVAAKGHQHFRVTKEGVATASTSLMQLDDNARIAEIGRMLSGETLTSHSLAHAREMVEKA